MLHAAMGWDGTLVISDVRPRCETCMEVSMGQRRIPPGGTATLEVKYEALDVVGEFTRYVVIESNNPSDRQVSVIPRVIQALSVPQMQRRQAPLCSYTASAG